MSKALAFVKLDYITVKPYLTAKNLLIFLLMAVVMSFTSGGGVVIGITMAFATIYVSYPFVVGEKSNIDILYATLSIKRNTVVLGRYLFALSFDILGALFSFTASYAVASFSGAEFDVNGSLAVTVTIFTMFTILQAIQLPLYFKMGYTKAKFLVYLPLGLMPVGLLLFSENFKRIIPFEQAESLVNWLAANPLYTAALIFAVWVMIMMFSYGAAIKAYNKRDL